MFQDHNRILGVAFLACWFWAGVGGTVACRSSIEPAAAPEPSVERRAAPLTILARTGWVASASVNSTTAVNAINTTTTDRWTTGVSQANGQWFKVDFGSPRTFMAVTLDTRTTPGEYPRTFRVETSSDNTTFTQVAAATGAMPLVTVNFASQTARYVRVFLTAAASPAANWSIYEFNVYAAGLPRTGWIATASSTATGTGGTTFVGSNAFDGNTSTRWSSAGGQTGQSFQVDMLAAQTFNQITLDSGTATPNNFPRGYQVFASNDTANFGSAIATGVGTSALTVISFPFQQARFIKINQTATNTTAWSIEELNVIGQQTTAVAHNRGGWTPSGSTAASGTTAAGAIDGSTTTRWTTSANQSTTAGQFFQVNMLTYRTFNQVVLDAGSTTSNNFLRGYQLQVSNNGTSWTTVIPSGVGSARVVTINLSAPQTAQFIKIIPNANFAAPWSIEEMTVSGPALLGAGWSATATSTGASDFAANALDGVATTRWNTSALQASGQTFQVDMGTSQIFNQLTLDAGTSTGNFPRAFAVSVSNDGTNFGTPVATGTGTTQFVTVNFLTQTARHFKIALTGSSLSNTWSIHELNVWRIAQPCDTVTCTAQDVCHAAGVCDPNAGTCSNPVAANPTTINCTDGDACTTSDHCTLAGTCVGTAVVCAALDVCHMAGTCTAGVCSNPVATNPTAISCTDSNACTTSDHCTLAGTCVGTAVVCTALDVCHMAGTCTNGVCSNPVATNPTAISCTDSNACTTSDHCTLAGTCVGTAVVCTALDVCHAAGTCTNGVCSNPVATNPTTISCTDGDACTTSDHCTLAGTCVGTAMVCTALDVCHMAGTCTAGVCSNPVASNPTTINCTDGNACTTSDRCTAAGTCVGTAVTCTALDVCHVAGTCSAGVCSNPIANNGTGCSDGKACTTGDVCTNGVCAGTVSCAPPAGAGSCQVGACGPTGSCVFASANEGDTCTDSNACTPTATCHAGACAGTLACADEVQIRPPGNDAWMLFHVWGSSPTDYYVSAWNGMMFHHKASGVVSSAAVVSGGNGSGLWGWSASDVYSSSGKDIIHSAGDDVWTVQPSPGAGWIQAIWGSSSSDVYAVGSLGTILHKIGGNWIIETSDLPTTATINGIGGSSASNVFATGALGDSLATGFIIKRQPNGTWTTQYAAPYGPGGSVLVNSPTDVYAVGSFGAIMHLGSDGVWNPQQLPPSLLYPHHIGGIWAPPGGTPIFIAVGSDTHAPQGGSIMKSTGDGVWTTVVTTPTTMQTGLWGDSANSLWVAGWGPHDLPVGGYESHLHHVSLDGTGCALWADTNACTADSCDPGTGLAVHTALTGTTCSDGNPCTQADTCQTGTCTPGILVTCTGDQCHSAGSCDPATGVCANQPVANGTSCTDGNGCSLGDKCSFGQCGGLAPTCSQDEAIDRTHAPSIYLLSDIWGTDVNNIYATGYNGAILHRTGSGPFVAQELSTGQPVGKIWGTSATNVYALSRYGVAYSAGNDVWTVQPIAGSGSLAGLWGSSSSDIYAGDGDNGRIYHSTGDGTWQVDITLAPGMHISAIGGSSASDVYAVGYDANDTSAGFIMHRGITGAWQFQLLHFGKNVPGSGGAGFPLDNIWVNNPFDIYVVGSVGTILHSTGDPINPQWTLQYMEPALATIYSIWAPASGTPIFAGTGSSVIVKTDGTRPDGTATWTHVDSGTTAMGVSLWGDSATSLWIASGINGPIIHHVLLEGAPGCNAWDDHNPCTADACVAPGEPSHLWVQDGTACTSSACSTGDTCHSGQCTGGTNVTCNTDQCHTVGVCNPASGCPAPIAKADGTSCDDGNPCSLVDVCTSGACAGPTPTCSGNVSLPPAAGLLNDVWGPGTGDIYASGYNGVMVHQKPNGTVSMQTIPGASHLGRIWGTGANSIYTVSVNKVYYSTGDDVWHEQPTPGTGHLNTVWGSSTNDVYVGDYDNGQIFHSIAGGPWQSDGSPVVGKRIMAIQGSGPNDIYAVGFEEQLTSHPGFIIHRTGGVWTSQVSGYGPQVPGSGGFGYALQDLWVNGANDVYVVGEGGTVLHWKGQGTWEQSREQTNVTASFGRVWGAPGGGTVFVSGLGGALTKSTGHGDWAPVVAGMPGFAVPGLWGDSPTSLWLAGYDMNVSPWLPSLRHVTLDGNQCDGWPDSDPCTVSMCDPSTGVRQVPGPDLVACDDGNPCTEADTCHAGVCQAGTPKACTASDQCHGVGTCDPATGGCSNPPQPDETPCSDGNACTQADICIRGACAPGITQTCAAFDQCHLAGTCNPANGACTNPVNPDPVCNGAQPTVTTQTETTPGISPREGFRLDPSSGTLTVGAAQAGSDATSPQPTTVVVPALQGSTIVCVADVNGDGTVDVVTANATTHVVQFLPRSDQQVAVFDPAQIGLIDGSAPAGEPGPAACDDVDGNGLIDIVMSFATPNSNGTTTPALLAYMNQGGSFQRVVIPSGFPQDVVVGGPTLADFNGDGYPDLVVYAANNQPLLDSQVFVFPNSGGGAPGFASGTHVSVPLTGVLATHDAPNWGAVATLDADGDGIPDIWALGNRGAVILYRGLGGFQFADPEFDGVVTGLSPKFTVFSLDRTGDGIPDLTVVPRVPFPLPPGTPPAAPPSIYPGLGGGVLARTPTPMPGLTPSSDLLKGKTFKPFVPVDGSQAVGLVKGSPVVTTYIDENWAEQPSIFMQAVNGHLVERLRYLRKPTYSEVRAAAASVDLPPPLHDAVCTSWFCDSSTGTVTTFQERIQSTPPVLTWVWVDHGVPQQGDAGSMPAHGTIVDSQPAVAIDETDTTVVRHVFVRGADGHLWELHQQNGQENWLDFGLAPQVVSGDPLEPTTGTVVPLVGSPSVITQTLFGQTQVPLVFILDAAGRMNILHAKGPFADWVFEPAGRIGKGNCFGAVGMLGDGSPKALSWWGTDGVQHLQAFVVSAQGDLFSWRDGVWEESWSPYKFDITGLIPVDDPADYQNMTPLAVCPNDPSTDTPFYYHGGYLRQAQGRGTPAAVAYGVNLLGTLHVTVLSVYVRGADGSIQRYIGIGDGAPVAASLASPPQVGFNAQAPQGVGGISHRGVQPILQVLTPPLCKYPKLHPVAHQTFKSDPFAIQDRVTGDVSVLLTDDEDNLALLHHPTVPPSVGSRWAQADPFEWEAPRKNQYQQFFSIIGSAGARIASSPNVPMYLEVFAIRSDGILDQGADTPGAEGWHDCGGLERCLSSEPNCSTPYINTGTHVDLAWNPYGFCAMDTHLGSFCLTQSSFYWTDPALVARGLAVSHAPPNAPRIKSSDLANGDFGCTADWTEVAGMIPQHARVEESMTVADNDIVKWPLLYPSLPLDPETGVPQPGAQWFTGYNAEKMVEVQGVVLASHISSEDNPMSHTLESSLVVPQIHHDWNIIIAPDIEYQDKLTDGTMKLGGTMELEWEVGDHLSNNERVVGTRGFTTDTVPTVGDRVAVRGRYIYDCGHLPYHTEIHPIDAMAIVHGQKVSLRISDFGGRDWWAPADSNIWKSTLVDFHPCSLEQSLKDLKKDVTADYVSLLKLVWHGVCGDLRELSQFSAITECLGDYRHDLKAKPGLPAGVPLRIDLPGSEPHTLSEDDLVMSRGTTSFNFGTVPTQRRFKVCFERTARVGGDGLVGHDHRHKDVTILGFPVCNDDDSEESVIYITANNASKLYAATDNCLNVEVSNDQMLQVGAHGFECDFSCGELPDEEGLAVSNDRQGTIRAAFTERENFGAPLGPKGVFKDYNLISQPRTDTKRSRVITQGDYKMKISIREEP